MNTHNQSRKSAAISILGSGIVGTTVGKGLAKLGNETIFYDVYREKVKQFCSQGYKATSDVNAAISNSEISFICVPTPTVHSKIDLSYVKDVAKKLAKSLQEKEDYHLVVVKSTALPTTTENVIIPILERYSKKKVGEHIGVCSNPEFLTEINRSWTNDKEFSVGFFEEPFIVIGEFDKRSGDKLEAIYKSMSAPIVRTNLRTAEMMKYALNCALACRISYWNEIFYLCQKLGVDSAVVAQTVGTDKRIGKYGTIHGKAFGGKCLPKDLQAFVNFSEILGYEPSLLKAVLEMNNRIKTERGVRE
jgi:UDPglucose 6-dehydrogenase